MTEREKNGEQLAMRMSRHRQAKHESLKNEDVKTAYIKGCEDTAREMTWKYEKQKEINKELVDENESLKKSFVLKDIARICKDKDEAQKELKKAIELLKQFLKAKNGEDTYKAEWEAEQFLKEIEK